MLLAKLRGYSANRRVKKLQEVEDEKRRRSIYERWLLDRAEDKRILESMYPRRTSLFIECSNCGWKGNLANTLVHRVWGEYYKREPYFADYKGAEGVECPRCKNPLPLSGFKEMAKEGMG